MNIEEHIARLRHPTCFKREAELADLIEILSAEDRIKDRALRAACHYLNLWASDVPHDQAQRILRMRDQCLNALSGKLSSDPVHEDIGHQYGPRASVSTRTNQGSDANLEKTGTNSRFFPYATKGSKICIKTSVVGVLALLWGSGNTMSVASWTLIIPPRLGSDPTASFCNAKVMQIRMDKKIVVTIFLIMSCLLLRKNLNSDLSPDRGNKNDNFM